MRLWKESDRTGRVTAASMLVLAAVNVAFTLAWGSPINLVLAVVLPASALLWLDTGRLHEGASNLHPNPEEKK